MCVVSLLSSLHQRVHAALASAIAEGGLRPGAILLEASIAEALMTSRTPVKAALEALRAEGRLAKRPGRGYVVLDADGGQPRHAIRVERATFAALAKPDAFSSRAPAAWARIYHEVETQIAGGALYGRMRIIELELAKAFGVSRTVAREVLSQIEKAGLVFKDERNFWRILPLTPERTTHIYEIRRALEPIALRRAAERGRHDGAADMRDRLEAARGRLPNVAAHEVCGFERELHVDLLSACGNPEIVRALRSGQLQIAANRRLFGELTEHFPQILREHLEVADRLAANDLGGASEALAAHLDEAKAILIDRVTALATASPPTFPSYLQRERDL